MKLKYYLYFSDLKLDMLFPQLRRWDKIKLRLSLGFKSFFMKLTLEGEKHKYMRMKHLSKYIHKKCSVGTIEAPKSYISGTAKMKWGIIPMDAGDMVLFFLQKANLVFVLGGTPENLITKNKHPQTDIQSRSDLFSILTFFRSLDYDSIINTERLSLMSEREVPEAIQYISTSKQLVEQEIEFLAKVFLETRYDIDTNIRVIIGSPIYVSVI